jgi:DNA helicase-2/ATP-dependent DNA helicase PcrA
MAITPQQQAAERLKQLSAAHELNEQTRLVAGPGTGKSSVIEERVRWLLENGVAPKAIAVVSFTNASARDLEIRINSYCEDKQLNARSVSITTLHSLALKVLRLGGLLQYYPSNPLVLDDWELENVYDAEFGIAQGIKGKKRREEIRRFYEALWSTGSRDAPTYIPPATPITSAEQDRFLEFHEPTAMVYSCVLPGEIVRKCVDATKSGTLDPVQRLAIKHLIVDEYQDLNPADIEFVDHIARQGVHVFVAGDDDQSIYSFRHASPLGIQTFRERFPTAADKVLDGCFRCTPAVLNAASSIIKGNAAPKRIAKSLSSLYVKAEPPNQGVVHRWILGNALAEASAIAFSCSALLQGGLPPSDILILLPTRKASIQLWPAIRQELIGAKLPFEPPKEEGFIDSETGRLVLSLARIVCSKDGQGIPQDIVAHRVLLGLKSGVGVKTCNSIRETVLTTANVSFRGLFYGPASAVPMGSRQQRALNHARTTCEEILAWLPSDTLGERHEEIGQVVERTRDATARKAWVGFAGGLPQDMNLEELRDYLWADSDQQRGTVISALSERLGVPAPTELFPPKIRVMTMHGAKGLSARVVFIPGLEHGILPNDHQLPYPSQLLEAARLLYVSISRARACCILSYAKYRIVFGQSSAQTPSQFAAQTGGKFVWRQSGLTDGEVAAIRESINLL